MMRRLASWRWRRGRRGQATTEVVLLLPLFMFFLFAFSKLFATLVLIQKMEIASYYAARRWQLESHRNVAHETFDDTRLCPHIEERVKEYLGFYDATTKGFLGLESVAVCPVQRTQVWNVVTLTVFTSPISMPLMQTGGYKFEVVKYVPNRDRPIAFVLPGLGP
ncbi:hypothetical protein ACFL2T_06570 [Elusimicrobiota bacterium]